jgi:hypothetical protein
MSRGDETRKAWVKGLKVGDQVGVEHHRNGCAEPDVRLAKVEKVLPSGKFRISGTDALFDADGEAARWSSWQSGPYLVEPTDEWRARLRMRRLRRHVETYFHTEHLDKAKLDAASADDLAKLLDAITPYRKAEA